MDEGGSKFLGETGLLAPVPGVKKGRIADAGVVNENRGPTGVMPVLLPLYPRFCQAVHTPSHF